MEWVCIMNREMINVYKLVTGNPQGRHTLRDPGISGKLKNSTSDLPRAPSKPMARTSGFIII
jgi:hypothetical protein